MMVMYEHDPDVLRWGFDFLNGDPFSTTSYCGETTESDVSFYEGTYAREGGFGTDHTSLGVDEAIAHPLREEFSLLAVVAEANSPENGEEHLQASALEQNWFGTTTRNYTSVYEDGEDSDDTEPGSSCCSPGEASLDGDMWSLELMEDYSTIDGELGKRFNLLVPTPVSSNISAYFDSIDSLNIV